MTADERDRLLDLHRAAIRAEANFWSRGGSFRDAIAADDAFRDYLMGMEVTE